MNNISAKYVEPIIFNLKAWVDIVDIQILEKLFSQTLQSAGFTVLDFTKHRFPANAYTAFWLLAESHLAIHTFVENNTCYVELSSCNEAKTKEFKRILSLMDICIRWQADDIEKCIGKI